jgi:hypothetical protein
MAEPIILQYEEAPGMTGLDTAFTAENPEKSPRALIGCRKSEDEDILRQFIASEKFNSFFIYLFNVF